MVIADLDHRYPTLQLRAQSKSELGSFYYEPSINGYCHQFGREMAIFKKVVRKRALGFLIRCYTEKQDHAIL
jgi:hypothetical protein